MLCRLGGGDELSLYCFDINTNTSPGINYALGTWNASNVPNVNYVAQVLDNYYPKTNKPAALTDPNQKAAAVQAAIWFFSDRFVLNTSDPLHDVVSGIAAAVIAKGPAVAAGAAVGEHHPGHAERHRVDPRTVHGDGHGTRQRPASTTAVGPGPPRRPPSRRRAPRCSRIRQACDKSPMEPGCHPAKRSG